jgi:hypothetical protein
MKITFVLLLALTQLSLSSEVLEQQDLALTIYNNGQAMVKDTRKISFDQGQSQLSFTDVASTIQP